MFMAFSKFLVFPSETIREKYYHYPYFLKILYGKNTCFYNIFVVDGIY